MNRTSAGILAYRINANKLQVLLVHPGGPFFAKKDAGAWSIPKGEPNEGEDLLAVAKREFQEELGIKVSGVFNQLSPITQKGGKVVHAWCVAADVDVTSISSNTFSMEWPPRSGKTQQFPEVDKAGWFTTDIARTKINPAQIAFIDELEQRVSNTLAPGA